ncbi:MAG: hypothetical protein ACM3WV_10230 [Bacillota bacterium]
MANNIWEQLISAEEEADHIIREAEEKNALAYSRLKEKLEKEREGKLAELKNRMKEKSDQELAAAKREAERILSENAAEVEALRKHTGAKTSKVVEYVIGEILH